MPRRPPPQRQPPPFDPPDRDSLLYGDLHPEHAANLRALRSHWKWAAFSQFFYTFAPLLALPDIALADIEDDLARPRSLYLPRVIQRLLITLTQDRKINVDNWQSALRKQYYKRLPHANPLGPEPQVVYSDVEDDDAERDDAPDDTAARSSDPPEQLPDTPAEPLPEHAPSSIPEPEIATPAASISAPEQSKRESKRKSKKKGKVGSRAQSRGAANGEVIVPIEEGDSKDWLELELLEKLDSLHLLTEWQFQNTHRLRQLMKDDDESALWRIEPIGYDAKTNAYWLIGPDRLWIQRAPPKPPRSAKRKRASAKPKAAKASSSKVVPEDSDVDDDLPPSSKRKRVQRITRTSAVHSDPPPVTPSRSRAAKVQANKKLDAQAKELAEFQRQAVASAKTRATRQASASAQKRAVFGTRASARLRGSTRNDDEWQEIPDEWLKASSAEESDDGNENVNDEVNEHEDNGNADADGDDSSELTELSDSSEEEKPPAPSGTRKRGGAKVNGTAKAKKVEPKVEEDALPEEVPEEARPLPSDFVEWELICFTLYDWEHIADQFAKATQYLEKALYKVLSQSIVPAVTADLKEVERQRKVEDALVRRKRSSRIALREVEKEEARLAEMKHAGDAEKEARAKRAEARAQKEQAEREKREHAREQRRIEREEREERARRKEERSQNLATERNGSGSAKPSSTSAAHERHRALGSVQLSRVASRSSTSTQDWILECEICRKSGVNLDDGLPMVSCGSCSKWQHITCHDHADLAAGRPRRNWKSQQFYCTSCRYAIQNRRMSHGSVQSYMPPEQQRYPQSHAYVQKPHPPAGYSSMQHQVYRQPTSDLRYSQSAYTGERREQYPSTHQGSNAVNTYPQPSQYQSPASNGYTQYAQDQRNVYASSGSVRTPHTGISNGYPPTADVYARHQPPIPVPQRSTVYDVPAMSSLHQPTYPSSHSTSSVQYRESYPAPPPSRWNNGGDAAYYSSSNGIPSRGSADLGYVQGGSSSSSAWHRNNAAMHGERDAPPVVSPSGFTPTYNYPRP